MCFQWGLFPTSSFPKFSLPLKIKKLFPSGQYKSHLALSVLSTHHSQRSVSQPQSCHFLPGTFSMDFFTLKIFQNSSFSSQGLACCPSHVRPSFVPLYLHSNFLLLQSAHAFHEHPIPISLAPPPQVQGHRKMLQPFL